MLLVSVFLSFAVTLRRRKTLDGNRRGPNRAQSSGPDETTRVTALNRQRESGPLFARSVSIIRVQVKHGRFYGTSIPGPSFALSPFQANGRKTSIVISIRDHRLVIGTFSELQKTEKKKRLYSDRIRYKEGKFESAGQQKNACSIITDAYFITIEVKNYLMTSTRTVKTCYIARASANETWLHR